MRAKAKEGKGAPYAFRAVGFGNSASAVLLFLISADVNAGGAVYPRIAAKSVVTPLGT